MDPDPQSNSRREFISAAGWRFHPTDEELVRYLMKKINGIPIDLERMTEVKLYSYSPEHLTDTYPHMGEHKWYFFTRDCRYENSDERVAGDGYWKATGGYLNITVNDEGSILGHKRSFVYYIGTPVNGIETNWIMHEYKSSNHMKSDDFVLCEIYDKGNEKKEMEEDLSWWDDMPSEEENSGEEWKNDDIVN